MNEIELNKLNMSELKNKCKNIGLQGYSNKKKEGIIELLLNHSSNTNINTINATSSTKIISSTKTTVNNNLKDDISNNKSYLKLYDNNILYKLENDDKDNNNIKPILRMIDKAHDILYQSESIVGQKALQIIMSLLFIKLIQSFLSTKEEEGKIDLLNKKYYSDKFDDEDELNKIFGYFTDLKKIVVLGQKEIRNDTQNDAIKQMGEILKRHPITKKIYTEANFIKVREASTIQTLINDVIDDIKLQDFENNEDIIGEIYEHILTKYIKNQDWMKFLKEEKILVFMIHAWELVDG